jgi:hypothetical protein
LLDATKTIRDPEEELQEYAQRHTPGETHLAEFENWHQREYERMALDLGKL